MRIDELIAQRIEARLEAKLADLDSILDGILEKAIENALTRVLGVEVEAPKRTRTRTRKAKAEAEVEVAAPTAAAAAPKAEVVEPTAAAAPKAEVEPAPKTEPAPRVEPAPKAEVEAEALLTRLERAAQRLGEHYGPMLLRRARSLSRHAINPKGALAVLVAWAEGAPAEEVIAVLRGSEKLSDGTTLSGWKLLAARLGIPVK